MKESQEPILPVFIFTQQQIDPKKNKFYGSNSVQFMIESLVSLNKDIKEYNGELYFFKAPDTIKALDKIYKLLDKKVTELGWNPSYSPFALKRDKEIKAWCKKNNITFYEEEDQPLHNLFDETCLKKDGTPFKVFTPFRNYCQTNLEVRKVNKFTAFKFKKSSILKEHCLSNDKLGKLYTENKNLLVHGGRENALHLLQKIKNQKDYSKKRDNLTYETTHLGAYISFGVLSCREVYWKVRDVLGNKTGLESELYWALFYNMIMFRFHHVIGGHFKHQWDGIKYKNDKKFITAIMKAETGIPIIDAGLRQLYTTGFSHNRLRMVITSFMAKHCQLDPRWIEKWWANHLTDYNIYATNGGVSWVAGYGTDSMIAQRIFAYWTQTKKFDPKAEFIKQWIPELKSVEAKHIINWEENYVDYPNVDYKAPMFKHKDRRELYIKFLKKYTL
jgi:deoxyribodipyrimidine photo-lyase